MLALTKSWLLKDEQPYHGRRAKADAKSYNQLTATPDIYPKR